MDYLILFFVFLNGIVVGFLLTSHFLVAPAYKIIEETMEGWGRSLELLAEMAGLLEKSGAKK